jgi:hypothetical protein
MGFVFLLHPKGVDQIPVAVCNLSWTLMDTRVTANARLNKVRDSEEFTFQWFLFLADGNKYYIFFFLCLPFRCDMIELKDVHNY